MQIRRDALGIRRRGGKFRQILMYRVGRTDTYHSARRRRVLHLLHGGGGGLEFAVRLLVARQPDADHGLLFVSGPRSWCLEDPLGHRWYPAAPWWKGLSRVVRAWAADCVHVHHLSGHHHGLLRALKRLRLPYVCTLHDFHTVCPRVHLVPPQGVYCGAPAEPDACRRCLALSPRVRVDPVRWRDQHRPLLDGAECVVAPSRFVGEILSRYWPDLEVTYAPHVYAPPLLTDSPPVEPDAEGRYAVGVVGALGREKGGEMLEQLADLADRRSLPLRFVMLGDTFRLGGPQWLYGGHLFVHGSYRRDALPGLLRQHRVMLAAFPAVGPETFSFTLSEVWACGLPVLVPDFGALAERVRGSGAGWTIPDWHRPEAWLDALMEYVRAPLLLSTAGARGREMAEAALRTL